MRLAIHLLIAFIALLFGYTEGGTIFILAIAPYLIYMVLKCDAIYLPALLLHCASETSAQTIVFISFVLLSILKYKEIFKLQLKTLFLILIGLLPVFVWLVFTSIANYNMYPPSAFAQTGYYLSFFAFFYGALISKTITQKIVIAIYVTLFTTYILYAVGALEFTRITVGFNFLFISAFALYLASQVKGKILLVISLFAFLSIILIKEGTTLTTLFVSLASLLIAFFYFKGRDRIINKITGIYPFVIIIIVYVYAIGSYLDTDRVILPNRASIFYWQNLGQWIHWKLFSDRAPFWAGGINQIIEYKNLLPKANMPDITTVLRNRSEISISFGAHTTMIELLRKYGIIPGTLLNCCLIYIVLVARKIFSIPGINPYYIPLFSMAVVVTIVLTLSGIFHITPGYALLSLGILGVAYGYRHYRDYNPENIA